ncbi:carbohydrate-binding protein [Streptomyces sp. NBC_00648]
MAAWSGTAVYTSGNEVSHNGRMWKAKWWTRNEESGTTGQWGGWQDEGAC